MTIFVSNSSHGICEGTPSYVGEEEQEEEELNESANKRRFNKCRSLGRPFIIPYQQHIYTEKGGNKKSCTYHIISLHL